MANTSPGNPGPEPTSSKVGPLTAKATLALSSRWRLTIASGERTAVRL